ncbi:MAG: hypothetical protein WB999_16845 [Candidatus Binataceae bacterium]
MDHQEFEKRWRARWGMVIKAVKSGPPWEDARFFDTAVLQSVDDIVDLQGVDGIELDRRFVVTANPGYGDPPRGLAVDLFVHSEPEQKRLHEFLSRHTGETLATIKVPL